MCHGGSIFRIFSRKANRQPAPERNNRTKIQNCKTNINGQDTRPLFGYTCATTNTHARTYTECLTLPRRNLSSPFFFCCASAHVLQGQVLLRNADQGGNRVVCCAQLPGCNGPSVRQHVTLSKSQQFRKMVSLSLSLSREVECDFGQKQRNDSVTSSKSQWLIRTLFGS